MGDDSRPRPRGGTGAGRRPAKGPAQPPGVTGVCDPLRLPRIAKLGNREVVPELVEILRAIKPEGAAGGLLNKPFMHTFNGPWTGTPEDEYDGPRPRPKASICFALGKLGDPRAVPALVEVLEDQRHVFETRQAAAFALGLIADPSSKEALERLRGTTPT